MVNQSLLSLLGFFVVVNGLSCRDFSVAVTLFLKNLKLLLFNSAWIVDKNIVRALSIFSCCFRRMCKVELEWWFYSSLKGGYMVEKMDD